MLSALYWELIYFALSLKNNTVQQASSDKSSLYAKWSGQNDSFGHIGNLMTSAYFTLFYLIAIQIYQLGGEKKT